MNTLKKKAFSTDDMMKVVDGNTNVMAYPKLRHYNNIDEVLGKHGACIVLYETKKNYGHWCLIFKLSPTTIEFFDPYCYSVDEQLKFIPKNFRKENNEKFPHLSYLLYNSPYKLTYNHHRFQKLAKDVNTCGRWCSIRLVLRNLPLKKFIKLFEGTDEFNSDTLVTVLTGFI